MKKILLLLCLTCVNFAASADNGEYAQWKFVEDSLTKSSSLGKFSNIVVDNIGGLVAVGLVFCSLCRWRWTEEVAIDLELPFVFGSLVGGYVLTAYGRTWIQKILSLNTFLTNWPKNKEKSPQALWTYFDEQYELFLKNKFMYLVKNTSCVNREFSNLKTAYEQR